jgi:hypothetical protein
MFSPSSKRTEGGNHATHDENLVGFRQKEEGGEFALRFPKQTSGILVGFPAGKEPGRMRGLDSYLTHRDCVSLCNV